MVLSNRTMRSLFSAFLACTGLVVLVWFLAHEFPRMEAIKGPNGRTTQGTVESAVDRVQQNKHILEATIVFTDEHGQAHQFTDSFAPEVWANLSAGQAVGVRYLITDPEFAYCTTSYKATRNPLTVVIMGLLLMTVGTIAWVISRRMR